MSRTTAISITGSFIISAALMALLHITAFDYRSQKNEFLRRFVPHVILETDTIDLTYNSYYIAGATDYSVFLGNTTAPLHLLSIPINKPSDTTHIQLTALGIEKYKFWALKVKVDTPQFFLLDGAVPVIFSGDMDDWTASRNVYDSAFFTHAVPLSSGSFIVRTVARDSNQYVLAKQTNSKPNIDFHFDLLEKQIDGRFCVDGQILLDKASNRLVYMYYYRNEFIVTDTSLNLAYRGNTIDTTSVAKIQVADIRSENARTFSAPPLMVNKRGAISGESLFINSALMARNENPATFASGSVIDVYSLKNGSYRFSFYLRHFEGKRLREFKVTKARLIALFGDKMVIYSFTKNFDNDHLL